MFNSFDESDTEGAFDIPAQTFFSLEVFMHFDGC